VRARGGHPAPFTLRYVEVGNEDNFDRAGTYDGRYDQFWLGAAPRRSDLRAGSGLWRRTPFVGCRQRQRDIFDPLFYDEFSDPDMIRVGSDYYLTGTTMHTMPGLPILHSRDLVNWQFIGYAFDRLDLGPDFRLEGGRSIYGGGIWAPSFHYHNGTYYIFANVNRFGLQVYRASDPRGPWKHNRIEPGMHDLSVPFDDDGKIYAAYGARTIRIVESNQDLTAVLHGKAPPFARRCFGYASSPR